MKDQATIFPEHVPGTGRLRRAARLIIAIFRAQWRAMIAAIDHEERFLMRLVTGGPAYQGRNRFCPLCGRVHPE